MEHIEKYVRCHEFKDLTAAHLAKCILEDTGNEYNARQIGLSLGKLVQSHIISRRILNGCYLYSSKAVGLPPAPPPVPPPSLTVQTATPITLNTVQFSPACDTPYEPDEKYGEIQAALDATLSKMDDYKSLNVKLYNALLKSEKERLAYIDFLTYISDKLSTFP